MEKWNKICYYLSDKIKTDILEKQFEPIVEKGLEILGWSEYSDDFVIRPSIQLGSRKERITPDFVVKSNKSREKLFVIEIKRPKQPLNEQNQIQLSTYMRQYKLDFGLLIGPKIQIFYDGELNKTDNAILIEEIEFIRDNNKGLKFVQLFQKESFSLIKLKEYAHFKFAEFENKREVGKLRKELLGLTQNTLRKGLKTYFLNSYSESIIDEVLESLEIQIIDNNIVNPQLETNTNFKEVNKKLDKTRLKKKDCLVIINEYLRGNNLPEIYGKDTVFSNLTKSSKNWWIDINPKNFNKSFFMVFNDYKGKKLFVFEIPNKTFYPPEKYFDYREDSDRYSILVSGDDKKFFKDTKRKENSVRFRQFLKYEIKYKEIRNIPNNETIKAIYEAHNSKDLKPIEDLDEYFESL